MATGPRVVVAIIGDGATGKSAITIKLTVNNFVEEYDPTIADVFYHTITVDGIAFHLEICDCSGQEENNVANYMSYKAAEAFLLVYDITRRQTFDNLDAFISHVYNAKDKATENKNSNIIPMILIGNKVDLVEQRKVSTVEGDKYAKSKRMAFLETSAKTGTNITLAWEDAVRLALARRPRTKPKSCTIL